MNIQERRIHEATLAGIPESIRIKNQDLQLWLNKPAPFDYDAAAKIRSIKAHINDLELQRQRLLDMLSDTGMHYTVRLHITKASYKFRVLKVEEKQTIIDRLVLNRVTPMIDDPTKHTTTQYFQAYAITEDQIPNVKQMLCYRALAELNTDNELTHAAIKKLTQNMERNQRKKQVVAQLLKEQ